MNFALSLMLEFDQELAQTRKTLERVPDPLFGWKPHEKSFTMGEMAAHIESLLEWGLDVLTKDSYDARPEDMAANKAKEPKTQAELIASFDKHREQFRAALEKMDNDSFLKPWSLSVGGKNIFTIPRIAAVRGMIMNHMIHHRGQLTVYFRLNDIPVPGLYGPSADEPGM
ncbi:MAG: DinB family protein [Vulcanimicrobiota bacterium]